MTEHVHMMQRPFDAARWLRVAVPLALACAAIVFAVRALRPGPADVPAYTAAPAAPLRADPGVLVDLALAPAAPVTGRVEARVYVIGSTGASPWAGGVSVSQDGTIRLSGAGRSLVGADTLRVVVGRPDAIGTEAMAVEKARAGGSGRGWQVLVLPVTR
jgi:hypothetical protein